MDTIDRGYVVFEQICRIGFILLFAYSGMEKLADFAVFRIHMLRQPFPGWMAAGLAWIVPALELGIALVMALPGKRWILGLLAFFGVMLAFSFYALFAALQSEANRPCACGGFFELLSWPQHAVLNFIIAGMAGILLFRTHSRLKHN